MNWDDLKPFLALIQEGSLSGAARSLRVEYATIARRINRMGARLDTSSFIVCPRVASNVRGFGPCRESRSRSWQRQFWLSALDRSGAGDRAVAGLLRQRIAACRECSPVATFVFDPARRQSARLARAADFVAEVLTKTFRSDR